MSSVFCTESSKKEFIHVEELLMKGQYDEVLHFVDRLQKKVNLQLIDQLACYLLKSTTLNKKGHFKEALTLAEHTYQKSQELKMPLQAFDALIIMAEAFHHLEKYDEAFTMVSQAENLLKLLKKDQPVGLASKEAAIVFRKGETHLKKGNYDQALEYFLERLSFKKELDNNQDDASSLNNIGSIYWHKGDLDQALFYYQQSMRVIEEIGNPGQLAKSLNNIGLVYANKGDLDLALSYLKKSLVLKKEFDNKQDISKSLNNIGQVYRKMGNLDCALEYCQQSLALYEEIGNKQYMAGSLNNIGNIYRDKGDLDRALQCFKKSLKIFEEFGHKQYIAYSLNNLGNVYRNKGYLIQSLDYYQQAHVYFNELANKQAVAGSLLNISLIYRERGELDQALKHLKESLALREELGNKQEIARALSYIGVVYWHKGNLNQATSCLEQSMVILEKQSNDLHKSETLFYLIAVALDKASLLEGYNLTTEDDLLEQTQIYLRQLREIYQKENNKIVIQRYQLAKALLLSTNPEKDNKMEARRVFQQIIEKEIVSYELTMFARLHLCRILLEQFVLTGEQSILQDLQKQLKAILTLAEKEDLFEVILTIWFLQGKMELLQLNIPEAMLYFKKVRKKAYERGYNLLEQQSENELSALPGYSTIKGVLRMEKAHQDRSRQQQIENIISYLQKVVIFEDS